MRGPERAARGGADGDGEGEEEQGEGEEVSGEMGLRRARGEGGVEEGRKAGGQLTRGRDAERMACDRARDENTRERGSTEDAQCWAMRAAAAHEGLRRAWRGMCCWQSIRSSTERAEVASSSGRKGEGQKSGQRVEWEERLEEIWEMA